MNQQPENQEPMLTQPEPANQTLIQDPTLGPQPQGSLPPKKAPLTKIVLIAALLVAVLVAVGIWFAFFRVSISAEDYKQADSDMTALREAYGKVYDETDNLPAMIKSYTPSQDDSDVESLKGLFEDYKQKSDDFMKLNALKDGDIRQQYESFVKQNNTFIVFMNGFFDSVPALKATETCKNANFSNYTDKTALIVFDKALGPCLSAVEAMKESSNTAISKYGIASKKPLDELRGLYEDLQEAALAQDTATVNKVRGQILSIDTSKMLVEEDKALVDSVDAIDLTDQLKSLQDALKSKLSSL